MEAINSNQKLDLDVSVSGYKIIRFATYYTIQLTRKSTGQEYTLDKRYRQFSDLNDLLKAKNYVDLPRIPPKTIMPVRNQEDLVRRNTELDNYMKTLINRCDIRNSRDLVKFLELDKHAPDVLIQKPKVIEMLECSQTYFYVTHCIFIPKNNIFMLCLNDKFKKNSKLEVYSLRHTGVVRDSYANKSGGVSLQDVYDPIAKTFSFNSCLGSKSTLLNTDSDQRESQPTSIIERQENSEKLLEYLFNNQIKAMTFCKELDLLSLGFKDGKIQSFFLNIEEEQEAVENSENEYFEGDSNELFQGCKRETPSKRKKKDNDGTLLMKKAFEQAGDYDDEEGVSINKPIKRKISNEDLIQNHYSYDVDTQRHFLEFSRHSCIIAHKDKINDMQIDKKKNFLYSVGMDKKLNIIDLTQKQAVNYLKTSNARIKSILIDSKMRRLYASSQEGQVFIFKMSSTTPIMMHSFTFAEEFGYIKSIQYDKLKKVLICLTKSSQSVCIQVDTKDGKNSKVTTSISNPYDPERICKIQWIQRMSCFTTGSDKGKTRFCEVTPEGMCMFVMPTDFKEKVSCIHYNKDKNMIFAGAKDGKFRVWKIPKDWTWSKYAKE